MFEIRWPQKLSFTFVFPPPFSPQWSSPCPPCPPCPQCRALTAQNIITTIYQISILTGMDPIGFIIFNIIILKGFLQLNNKYLQCNRFDLIVLYREDLTGGKHWNLLRLCWFPDTLETTETDVKEASSQASKPPLLPLIRPKYCNWHTLILNTIPNIIPNIEYKTINNKTNNKVYTSIVIFDSYLVAMISQRRKL